MQTMNPDRHEPVSSRPITEKKQWHTPRLMGEKQSGAIQEEFAAGEILATRSTDARKRKSSRR
jgi:hypothetical protein